MPNQMNKVVEFCLLTLLRAPRRLQEKNQKRSVNILDVGGLTAFVIALRGHDLTPKGIPKLHFLSFASPVKSNLMLGISGMEKW